MCVLRPGTPINVNMPGENLTPEQRSLTNKANCHIKNFQRGGDVIQKRVNSNSETEADISVMESVLKSALDAKKIIAECYTELSVQIPERAAEYSEKIDDMETLFEGFLDLCTNRMAQIRASIAQAVQQRIDQLSHEQDLRLGIAQSQAAALAPTVVAGASATGTPVKSSTMKPISDLKPAKLNRDATPLELNNWIRAYTAYAAASNFEVTSLEIQRGFVYACLEDDLQEYVSSKADDTTGVLGDDGIICIIKKRFDVKYPLFTKRLQYFNYEQRKEQSYSEFRAQLQQLHQEANIKDLGPEEILSFRVFCGLSDVKLREKILELDDPTIDEIDAEALKYETSRAMLNACKRGAGEASANQAESRGSGGKQYTPQSPGSLRGICKTCGREPHQEDELCPAQNRKCLHCNETGHFARSPEGIIICPANRQPRPQRRGGNGDGGRSHGGDGDHGPDRGDGDDGGRNSHARAAVGGDEDEDNGHSNQDQVHARANQVYECYLVGNQQENNEEFQPAPTRAGGVDHA